MCAISTSLPANCRIVSIESERVTTRNSISPSTVRRRRRAPLLSFNAAKVLGNRGGKMLLVSGCLVVSGAAAPGASNHFGPLTVHHGRLSLFVRARGRPHAQCAGRKRLPGRFFGPTACTYWHASGWLLPDRVCHSASTFVPRRWSGRRSDRLHYAAISVSRVVWDSDVRLVRH